MRKALVIGVLGIMIAGRGIAQNRFKFRSTEWLGLSTGQVGGTGAIQTVNGMAWGPWFAGVGAGVDYYRLRSVPLFLSLTRDIALGKNNWLYLFADGGKNVPWHGSSTEQRDEFEISNFGGGGYWAGGVGYLWGLGGHTSKAVLISAGYTVKKQSEDQRATIFCPLEGCPLVHYAYLNQYYLFMIGFRF